jgi:hypothetical protein
VTITNIREKKTKKKKKPKKKKPQNKTKTTQYKITTQLSSAQEERKGSIQVQTCE